MATMKEIREVPMSKLELARGQVRQRSVGKEIDELADSIERVGLLQPIVVCPTDNGEGYEILLGQRRFLACQELGKSKIRAAILDEKVSQTEAKILSVTENLVRRDLDTKDKIDVCSELYKKYGSIEAVKDETGLPRRKIRQYVKYPRLMDELKDLVDTHEVSVDTALRAQDAAEVSGDVDPDEAVELAKEMEPMSGAQKRKIVEDREKNPDSDVDDVIEHAKTGGKITQVNVTLTANVHQSLKDFAHDADSSMNDAAASLIEEGLIERGALDR